eukprot:IDg21619t1
MQQRFFMTERRSVSAVFPASGVSARSHSMSGTDDGDGADPQCIENAEDIIEADLERRDTFHAAQIASSEDISQRTSADFEDEGLASLESVVDSQDSVLDAGALNLPNKAREVLRTSLWPSAPISAARV